MINKTMSFQESQKFLTGCFNGSYTDSSIIETLEFLAQKGESSEEIAGFVTAMRLAMIPCPLSKYKEDVMDVCGTGGSQKTRFNISTAISFILASMSIPIAKHGNYGSQRKNGSFDFLDQLRIFYPKSPENIKKLFKTKHLVFLLARYFHPAMSKVANARKLFGKTSIFNYLGPFSNPCIPLSHQVIGTTSETMALRLYNTAILLNDPTETIITVGGDRRDDLSLTGTNLIYEKGSQKPKITEICASDYKLKTNSYHWGDAKENAYLFLKILQDGDYQHPLAHHLALNTAVAIYLFEKQTSIQEGINKVLDAIGKKQVYTYLQEYPSQRSNEEKP